VLGFARVQTLGRYELVKRLGSGGMGEVWLARTRGPERVQKLVVLKRLLPERLADETARARFVDEARVAVGLSHPRLVPVFDFGSSENGEYFLAMEYMRGGDLARIAGIDRAPLAWTAVALLGSELCDALAYVHAKKDRRDAGLVHGDVTPHNVLLSQEGHALLADFGLMRFAPRDRAGTRRYQAPEQARGEPFDGRADLYALALVLVEAATGKPAYDRDPAAAQTRVGLVPQLDGVDSELAAILKRALAPSPESRPDARSLRDQFDALLDREPRARTQGRAELAERVASMPPPNLPASLTEATRAAEPSRRWWMWVPVGVSLIAGGWWLSSRPPAPQPIALAPSPSPTVVVVISPSPVVVIAPPPAPPPSHPAKKARPLPSVAPAMARLDLNAMPWAHVRIDGEDRGDTPILDLELPAGPHRIELSNEPLGVHRELVVELHPGEHARRTETLR
jgi:serine/threonine-protein kinase